MILISKLYSLNLVRGLPILNYKSNVLCEACQKGKQTKSLFASRSVMVISRQLELLHIDLIDPVRTPSVGGKKYRLVIIDDHSKWTYAKFLKHKDESQSLHYFMQTSAK